MDAINIGVLLPSSTIFFIAKEFEKGLKEGLKPLKEQGVEVELVKKFIAGGDMKLTDNACNKFFNYDDVDIVTGIISNRSAAGIADRFITKDAPLLVNNAGGHVPAVDNLNPNIFINSMHLWRHAWSLGNWGVKTFGKKGMYVSAVYDAGYSFSQMFYEGMMAADPTAQWSFSVPPMPAAGGLTDVSIIFPFLEQYQPDFIFVTFCGAETTLFLNEFIARGWHHKTKVLGLPYLISPFAPLNQDITIYTTQPYTTAPKITADGVFYDLGLQTGEYITKAAYAATDRTQLRNELAKLDALFNSAQGAPSGVNEVTIIENNIAANATEFTAQTVTQWPTFSLDPQQLKPLTADIGAGWFNPYLCI